MTTTQLPQRMGPRPGASNEIPHRQLDQQPADRSLTDTIIDEARSWPHVHEHESAVSVEGARALVLDSAAAGPADAFLISTEFCHAHAQGDCSLHAALPPGMAAEAERSGWAEPHFLVATGQVPPTVVMIYAPRDEAERDTVRALVRASYEFAVGQQS